MEKRKNSNIKRKKKGVLFRTKIEIAGVISSEVHIKTFIIPSDALVLMLGCRSYESICSDPFQKGRLKTKRALTAKFLYEEKVLKVAGIPKGRFHDYFDKVKIE